MPDITMCANHDCPLRLQCERYLAKPAQYQSYVLFKFIRVGERTACDHFIKSKSIPHGKTKKDIQ